MPVIKIETIVTAPANIVFDLSRSIDLHKISTAHTKEEAIAGKTSGLIEMGESVTWRAKHFGITQELTSKITAFKPYEYFVDEMVSGAFRSFRHEHIFKYSAGQTKMIDVFEYQSPFGILGRLADMIFLRRYMEQLLKKRNLVIKDYAENEYEI